MSHVPYYIGAALGALIILSIIIFTTFRTETESEFTTWQSAGGFFSTSEPLLTPEPLTQPESPRGAGVESLGVVPLPSPPSDAETKTFVTELAGLLSNLTQPQKTAQGEPKDFVPSAYAFIPQGLVAQRTSSLRSPENQALYTYGNAIGSSLQTFADTHPDMPQILKEQAENRTDAAKKAALKRLAADFSKLGSDIAAISPIPPVAATAHAALAAAYADVGAKMNAIPDTSNDDAFLAAVNTYNTSAEELSKRLIGLADLFASRNVGFTPSDAGSIFIFSGNASF